MKPATKAKSAKRPAAGPVMIELTPALADIFATDLPQIADDMERAAQQGDLAEVIRLADDAGTLARKLQEYERGHDRRKAGKA
jgi:hypothetical protein